MVKHTIKIQDFEGVSGIVSLISVFDIDVCLDWRSQQLAATESIPPEHLVILNHAPGCWRMLLAWCNLLTKPKGFFFILNCIRNSCQISLEALLVPPFCQRATTSQSVAPHDTKFQEFTVKVMQTSGISIVLCKLTWLRRVDKNSQCSWKLLFFIEASMSCDPIPYRSDCTCSCGL